jgi:glyoxylase-like metal-dependent hydrolase (beta-lactamase superfamily II)
MLQTHLIDSRYCGYSKISAVYLLLAKTGECALVDSGTPGSFESILAQMRAFGADPSKLSSIFLTHGHLDHSGNISLFTRRFPDVRIYCNELTARGVISPEKHCQIMKRYVGDRWNSEFGDEVRPVSRSSLVTTYDGMRVPFGSAENVRVLDTPGHSRDHISFFEESTGTIFAGDAFGVRYGIMDSRKSFISIPPGFNPEDVYATIKKLKRVKNAEKVALAHYGFVDDVKGHADQCKCFMDKLMGVGQRARNLRADLWSLYSSEFGQEAMRLHRVRGNLASNLMGIQEWLHPSKSWGA